MCIHAENMQITDARFLPIISAYAEKIGLVERIDALLRCEMEVSPGRIVLAMILDALSGRSPLFRLNEFYADKDIELLLGEPIPLSKLSDDTLGRVLEKLWNVGTNKVLGTVMLGVMQNYDLDTSHVHHDTTSCELFGDYLLYESEDHDQPFRITNGFSKGHRPDLKQLVLSLLCVDHGIPIGMLVVDGNESDKTINKNLIPEMVERMRNLGESRFIYVADSALVTKENLELIDDWDNGFLFVSRLPMTYKECKFAIRRAVIDNDWEDIGVLAQDSGTGKHKGASYRSYETAVTLYGVNYRAVVIHSDAHDKRRRKKLDKQLAEDRKHLARIKKEIEKIEFACEPDAVEAAKRIPALGFHRLTASVAPKPKYKRGRPKADGTKVLKEMRYCLKISSEVNERAVQRAREEAGCFVLITNTLAEGTESIPAAKLLATYKEQHLVEQNFGFLKDPVFVNALFLKSPKRIEALGLVLVLALLIWRLMERTMRMHLEETESTVTGWDNRQTSRPTSFMMTTKFKGIFVLTSAERRSLAQPLTSVQMAYLAILEIAPEVFVTPPG
jgi:transposase